MSTQSAPLRKNADFIRLWIGQTVSLFGSQITTLALPLLAALTIGATPGQLGLLVAAGSLPDLLVSLVAGVWVDRLRRRPLLIAADLGRAALLLAIPLAAFAGVLHFWLLVAVAFGHGLLTTLFGIAYLSYVPALVPRGQLVEANGRLQVSSSVADVAGPGVAGTLVQAISAPVAILLDAGSYLISGMLLWRIRAAETPPAEARAGIWREIGAGLRLVGQTPLLRALAGTTSTFNFFDSFLSAVYVLYLTRALALGPAAVGAVFAIGGIGGLLGAAIAGPLARRAGVGRTLAGTIALAGAGELAIGLADGPPLVALAIVALAEATVQGSATIFGVTGVSLRQATTPAHLLGRMNASMRAFRTGLVPIGALLGGAVATRYGLRAAVLIAGVGTLFAVLWVLLSPVRGMREAGE
ncbi:MAG: MFS transporter [Thermomicrobiales bacterium]